MFIWNFEFCKMGVWGVYHDKVIDLNSVKIYQCFQNGLGNIAASMGRHFSSC